METISFKLDKYVIRIKTVNLEIYRFLQNHLRGYVTSDRNAAFTVYIHLNKKKYYTKESMYGAINELNKHRLLIQVGCNFSVIYPKAKAADLYINHYKFNLYVKVVLRWLLVLSFQSCVGRKNGFVVLHSAFSLINNNAFLFSGFSGIGKTTMIRSIKRYAQPVCEDVVLIKRRGKDLYATSFPQMVNMKGIAKTAEINSIFFLKRNSIFDCKRLDRDQGVNKLMRNIVENMWLDKKHYPDYFKRLHDQINNFKLADLNCIFYSLELSPNISNNSKYFFAFLEKDFNGKSKSRIHNSL